MPCIKNDALAHRISWCLLVALLASSCSEPPPSPPPNAPPPAELAAPDVGEPVVDLRVAVTIDDLPVAMRKDYKDDDERRETVRKLVGILNAREIPFVGFFNMVDDAADPTLTKTWLTATHMTLGNHTWSHPSARRTALDAYLADVDKGQHAVAALRPDQQVIPFRFPYLNQGFEPSKRRAIFEHLEQLGSPHAPVTIDTSDWLHARGYLEALHAGDAETADRWRQAWLWNIQESTITAEDWAEELFGRLPPQILLLHANRLNADHLGQALDWYTKRGYRFVSLAEALADPAYEEPDVSFSPIGDSHWLRLRRSRELEKPEVVDEAEEAAPSP